jgi:hypothetical protein
MIKVLGCGKDDVLTRRGVANLLGNVGQISVSSPQVFFGSEDQFSDTGDVVTKNNYFAIYEIGHS